MQEIVEELSEKQASARRRRAETVAAKSVRNCCVGIDTAEL